MLTKWKLFNFKSVQKETELALAPLTIFAGPNSSGKSTWIQSILLISQTVASKVQSPAAVVLNGYLTKLGQFDDLKSYGSGANQILIGWECEPRKPQFSSLSEESEIGLARAVSLGDMPERILGEIYFDADSSNSDKDLTQLQPRLFQYTMSCNSKDEDAINSISTFSVGLLSKPLAQKVQDLNVSPADIEAARSALECEIKLNENALKELRELREFFDLEVEPVGCAFSHHFLPSKLIVRCNEVIEETRLISSILLEEGIRVSPSYIMRQRNNPTIPLRAIKLLQDWFGDILPISNQPDIDQISLFPEIEPRAITLKDWMDGLRRLSSHRRGEFRQRLRRELSPEKLDELNQILYESLLENRQSPYALKSQQLPRKIRTAVNYLDSFFSNSVQYLGPLRDEPKPLYPLAPTVDPSDIGLRGEYTAAVFDRYKEKRITYIPTTCFPEPKGGQPLKEEYQTRTLKTAVLDWLRYLEVAEDLQTKDMGKLGHELKVTLPGLGKEQDLMHVGVGVSQVLPILVMCLLADEDTTLIFEQPELHLHPLVQTRLADFFLSMALLGKQCIIETHSEYLINRLRFRVASDITSEPRDTLAEQIKIYFAEKVKGASKYCEVTVNKYGAIVDWPKGFFDQSQREAEEILRASMAKRKQERQKKQEQLGEKPDA
ncbi:DUF3696 domain-containing protein [Oscillatoria sp. FACHB-1407]|uniref:AAA family ATPase n=1 Tax=Oscillatoria sp. FACHB-1407 TaxID=2692847 RepID=UPI001682B172|nr:DUF3696 domain-containing protein [Oscillatoria sp. FACHB-1407]MBD2463210.1 DUF3696 domain-containing protein [Oscillatoria sp. FACHB-1407]